MAGKLFISYRREDSAAYAGRVFDRLEREFGRDQLFMDVDAIPLGSKFADVIKNHIDHSAVVLVIIGSRWFEARDETGARRLDDPNDLVRLEVSIALRGNIALIPILLDGAHFPKLSQLPMDLQELPSRQALPVRHASFHTDLDKLVQQIEPYLAHFPIASGEDSEASLLPTVEPADVPRSVLATIRAEASRQHPDDYSTQSYVIEEQIKSYGRIAVISAPKVPKAMLAKIKSEATRQHPDDYSTQLYVIEDQITSFGKLEQIAAPKVPKDVLAKIKAEAARQHPDDYSTQLYVVEEQINSFRRLNS